MARKYFMKDKNWRRLIIAWRPPDWRVIDQKEVVAKRNFSMENNMLLTPTFVIMYEGENFQSPRLLTGAATAFQKRLAKHGIITKEVIVSPKDIQIIRDAHPVNITPKTFPEGDRPGTKKNLMPPIELPKKNVKKGVQGEIQF